MVSLVLAGIMIAGAITFIRKYSDTPFLVTKDISAGASRESR
ncbi:hypothetical protein SAMN02745225_00081 [Ferrithrix thermotolerans DSM 19514]|uniref:Uncharacterized protein n=1 Tax=Ferrithrix thermotolerans DSM 19514 TaxID=1121881 RepID=A0A1M4S5P1_9ACTN|nr:hypothetical protein [Ferrithrix thermotolerans]SHE27516.1 hypothetical protein SAMN02745225_00081 [Ferrithrix thermotolerans DSM 19514]